MTGIFDLIDRTLYDLALQEGYVNSHLLAQHVCRQAGLGQENVHSRRATRSYATSIADLVGREQRGEQSERRPRSRSRYLSQGTQLEIYHLAYLSTHRFTILLKQAGTPRSFNLDAETIFKLVERPEPELLTTPRPRLSALAATGS
jgi:hypothetical protein